MSQLPSARIEQVIGICTFFFPNNPPQPHEVNGELESVAAQMLHEALKASDALDFVPRPPGGVPGPGWLVLQALQVFWRSQGRQKIYESARVTVARNFKTEYELAKQGL